MNCNSAPLVSILVSCYNVRQFLPDFFKNIAAQTFKDYEIIVVDDGSTDNTIQLLNEFKNKFNNLKVITHKQNRGLGAARNTGLKAAKGKYVYFCDVDDQIKPDLLSYCSNLMQSDANLNYIIFGFDVSYPDMNFNDETITFKELRLRSNDEIREIYVPNLLLSRHGNGFVWNKFYRRSFLINNNLWFGNQRIQQDEVFNIKVLLCSNNIYISPISLYRYNIFSSGNNGSRYIEDRFEIFVEVRRNFENLFEKWDIKSDLTIQYLHKRFFGNILKCLNYDLTHSQCPLNKTEKRIRFKEITTHPYSKELRNYYHNNYSLSFKDKLYLNSMNNYSLYYLINSIFNLLYKLKYL